MLNGNCGQLLVGVIYSLGGQGCSALCLVEAGTIAGKCANHSIQKRVKGRIIGKIGSGLPPSSDMVLKGQPKVWGDNSGCPWPAFGQQSRSRPQRRSCSIGLHRRCYSHIYLIGPPWLLPRRALRRRSEFDQPGKLRAGSARCNV